MINAAAGIDEVVDNPRFRGFRKQYSRLYMDDSSWTHDARCDIESRDAEGIFLENRVEFLTGPGIYLRGRARGSYTSLLLC